MASLLFTSFALFSGCYANALLQPSRLAADPTITPGPRIPAALLQRQNNDRFMGWVSYDGEWISHDCQEGATLAQNGQYWICCGTDQPSCDMPMGCMSGSLIYDLTDSLSTLASGSITRATVACTDLYSDYESAASHTHCNVAYMFENLLDSDPQTNFNCGVSKVNWSYYRVKPEETAMPSEPSAVPANPTGPPEAPMQPDIDEHVKEKKGSNAWIAGAVVGPVAGLALIGAAIFIFMRRRGKKNTPAPSAAADPAPAYPGPPDAQYQKPYLPMDQSQSPGFVPYGVGGIPSDQKQGYYPGPTSPQTPMSAYPQYAQPDGPQEVDGSTSAQQPVAELDGGSYQAPAAPGQEQPRN